MKTDRSINEKPPNPYGKLGRKTERSRIKESFRGSLEAEIFAVPSC